LARLALRYAQDLKMPYDEALTLAFIGTHFCEDNLNAMISMEHVTFSKNLAQYGIAIEWTNHSRKIA